MQLCRRSLRAACLLTMGCLSIPSSPAETATNAPWYAVIEAEAMELQGDWRDVRGQEGYFPAAPNSWSGNRVRGGASADAARATAAFEVPADGRYAVWVRYESPYGFDVHFTVAITQGGTTVYAGRFGDRADAKCFNGAWRIQGPWSYHNTDYVYQRDVADLKRGQATLALTKESGGKYSAARIVDLVFLTDSLGLQPGRELNAWNERGGNAAAYYQPAIMTRCRRPFYFRLQTRPGAAAGRATLNYRFGSGWRGPRRMLAFTTAGRLAERYEFEYTGLVQQAARKRFAFPEEETLPGGFDSGWLRYDLNTFDTATLVANCETADATLQIAGNPAGREAAAFSLASNTPLEVLVATGDSRLEDELFRGRVAGTAEQFAGELAQALDAYHVAGRRPFLFGNLITPSAAFGAARWKLFTAAGGSGVYFQVPPDAYLPGNAERLGVNRAMAYRALQNLGLKFNYFEGDYGDLRLQLLKVRAGLDEAGLGDIPQTFKMIEESGPPALAKMRASDIISGKFRDYLKELGLSPAPFVGRAALAEAVAAGRTGEADLWPLVQLCDGRPQDAADNPALFYHSKQFGNLLFADNCAMAAKLVEEIFPPGSRANSGAIFPQDGHGVRRNWYDEFTLFRRRGMTSFGSETTWGLNGTPYYAGAQSQSYEGTIARGVAKYHDATLGPTHLLACKRYGYPPEFVELTAYALASHGYRAVHYYINADFTGLDHYKAMKRAGYALGAVEDHLVGARVVPGKVALGWSETTAVWDQAVPTESGYNRPGNLMYGIERHYLYLLLRHLQLPVDLLSEADVAEGRLKDYEVYFLVGDHMTAAAAQALRQWVEAGGVLISGAGGGLWDEYNRPLDTLKDLYGIKGARQYAAEQGRAYIPGETYAVNVNDNRLEKQEQALRAKLELLHALPMDTIAWAGRELPVLGYKQGLAPETGGVVATFDGGGAAIVTNAFGKGRALIMGFLPGIAYHYQAYPLRPYGRGGEDLSVYLHPDYKPLVRDAMAGLIRLVWPGMGAAVATAHPFVEANLMAGAQGGRHVALVNFSGQPVANLTVRIRAADVGNASRVSAAFGKPQVRQEGGDLIVTLSLDKFDWLTLN